MISRQEAAGVNRLGLLVLPSTLM